MGRFAHILAAAVNPDNLNMFDPAAVPADSIRDLFYLVIADTAVIFVLVEGMLLYCIYRFRRRPDDAREPPQMHGSKPIEVAWTVAPLLAVFILFLVVMRSVVETRRAKPPETALLVTVRGHQWWWEYEYPDLGIKTANELHVPIDQPVFLKLESADVVHSYWLPRLAGKIDMLPGQTNQMWFEPHQIGIFQGGCAEYCGTQHANMLIRAVVDSSADFEAWVADQRAPARDVPEFYKGKTLFFTHNCVSCHTLRGPMVGGIRAAGTYGPDLTHLASRQTLASAMVAWDTNAVRKKLLTQWILNPNDIKPGCKMPGFRFNDEEVEELVAYLESLK